MPTTTVNGVDLAYVEQGRGEPVLLVHGGSADYRAWERQMDSFAADHRTIALSCRGYWPNAALKPDDPITLDTHVDDIAGFIRALDTGPVHLVGHSSPGGFGGLLLAARSPELLRSLVLLEPPAFPLLGVTIPPRPTQLIKLLVRHPAAGAGFLIFGARGVRPAMRAFDSGDDERGLRIFMAANTSKDVVSAIPDEMFQRFVANVGPLKAQLRSGFPPFTVADARAIRVPTLLVRGGQSPAPLTAVTKRLGELMARVEGLTIAGASHNMFVSHPEEFNEGVLTFLAAHAAASP